MSRHYSVTVGWRTLPAGVRAIPGQVGYRGKAADLKVLNPGDSLTGTPFEGTSSTWAGATLEARGDNLVVNGWRINAALVFMGGADPVVRNCVISPPAGQIFCVTLNGAGLGTLTVEDTTIVGTPDLDTLEPQVNGISSDSRLIARRCDVSGSGDGIHAVAQPGTGFPDGSIISQCWIHDLSYIDPTQHLDGIQIFQQQSVETYVTIEHCLVEAVFGPNGEAMNAAATMGMPPANNGEALLAARVHNNAFLGGAYHLRFGRRMHNIVCTDNDLGVLRPAPDPAGEFGLVAVEEPGSVAVWSGNRDGDGNIVDNPNP